MTILGFVESVSANAIKGWCIDSSHDGVVDVELRVGAVSLGRVHADLYRRDLHEKWGRTAGGFRFPISPRLLSLLPHKESVGAYVDGNPLRFTVKCATHIENPEAAEAGKLAQLLEDGYVISPKSGGIHRPIGERLSPGRIFDAIARTNSLFERLFAKNLFICYGTLLGCVRSDDFIAHDDDVDVCFLSDARNVNAAAEEFSDIINVLRAEGEKVQWPGGAHFHWNMLDVFIAWFEDGVLYLYNAGGECEERVVLPLRLRRFKGRDVLVPNHPEQFLELIYGANWRTPDPMFQWRVEPEIRQNLRRFSDRLSQLLE